MLRVQSIIVLVIEFMSEGDDECVSDLCMLGCNITCMIIIILVCSYSGVSIHSFTCSVTTKLIRQKLPTPQALRQVMITDLWVSIISDLIIIGLYCEGTKAGLGRMAPQ